MDIGSNMHLILGGSILSAAGLLMMWWAGRYDLRGAAWASLSDVVLRRRARDNPSALERKWQEIAREATTGGKARRFATTVLGHFIAQAIGAGATILVATGGAIAAFGLFFR